jgi:hypothetical protein
MWAIQRELTAHGWNGQKPHPSVQKDVIYLENVPLKRVFFSSGLLIQVRRPLGALVGQPNESQVSPGRIA